MFSIFFLVGFAIVIAVILAVFVTRQKTPGGMPLVPPEDDYNADKKDRPELTREQVYAFAENLCGKNGLKLKDKMEIKPHEIYWITESANEFFYGTYVLGFFFVNADEPLVKMTDILEFKDFIKSLGSSKGFYFTNGYFTRDVHQPLEGTKVALYNRKKILDEMGSLNSGKK